MNHVTLISMMVLMTVGLACIIVFFGYAIVQTVRHNRNTAGMEQAAQESKEEFAVLLRNLEAISD
jgi:uncharacterized membrane protein